MIEPTMTPEAQAHIDAYTLRMARASTGTFAVVEEARNELSSHLVDLAKDAARRAGSRHVRHVDVLDAIRSVGPDAVVLSAFFPGDDASRGGRPWFLEPWVISAFLVLGATAIAFFISISAAAESVWDLEWLATLGTLFLSLAGLEALRRGFAWPAVGVGCGLVVAATGFGLNDLAHWWSWFPVGTLLATSGLLRALRAASVARQPDTVEPRPALPRP